ncbi:MAG: hypothetical protein QNK11_01380 [Legionella sp.]|nr:hypothetical protein [Legionella sp.]
MPNLTPATPEELKAFSRMIVKREDENIMRFIEEHPDCLKKPLGSKGMTKNLTPYAFAAKISSRAERNIEEQKHTLKIVRDASLRSAIDTEDTEFLNTLQALGARPMLSFSDGENPYDYARAQEKSESVAWIKNKAKQNLNSFFQPNALSEIDALQAQRNNLGAAEATAQIDNLASGLQRMTASN